MFSNPSFNDALNNCYINNIGVNMHILTVVLLEDLEELDKIISV